MEAQASRTAEAQRRLSLGTHAASGEKLDWSYYDSQRLLSTILSHRFFVAGIGQPMSDTSIKTLADTNILSAGIPNGQRFTVKALKLFFYCHALAVDATIQLIYDMLSHAVMTFLIDGKDKVFQIGLEELIGANFLVVNQPAATIGTQDHAKVMLRAAYPINLPIVLASLTRYEVQLDHLVAANAALNTDRIKISMQGILERLS